MFTVFLCFVFVNDEFLLILFIIAVAFEKDLLAAVHIIMLVIQNNCKFLIKDLGVWSDAS